MKRILFLFVFGFFAATSMSLPALCYAEAGGLPEVPDYQPSAAYSTPSTDTTQTYDTSTPTASDTSQFTLPMFDNFSLTSSSSPDEFINYVANNLLPIVLTLAGALAVLFVLFAGISYITSAGNPEKTKRARSGIINVIIGVVIILSAFMLVRFATSLGQTVANADTTTN